MVVFDIIWNIVWLLYALVGLLIFSTLAFLAMAFVAGLGERGLKQKEKTNGEKITK